MRYGSKDRKRITGTELIDRRKTIEGHWTDHRCLKFEVAARAGSVKRLISSTEDLLCRPEEDRGEEEQGWHALEREERKGKGKRENGVGWKILKAVPKWLNEESIIRGLKRGD